LRASLLPWRLRPTPALAPALGSRPAACTSRVARAWRTAAWALNRLGLACRAWSIKAVSWASPKRCHQRERSSGACCWGADWAACHAVGTAGMAPAGVKEVVWLQPASSRAPAKATANGSAAGRRAEEAMTGKEEKNA
jgi:hypothetical protein